MQSELGYYHAHQSKLPNDGIASHEYEMNKPKPLGVTTNVSRIPTKINRYSYEDLDNEVTTLVYFDFFVIMSFLNCY